VQASVHTLYNLTQPIKSAAVIPKLHNIGTIQPEQVNYFQLTDHSASYRTPDPELGYRGEQTVLSASYEAPHLQLGYAEDTLKQVETGRSANLLAFKPALGYIDAQLH
jgi:hypothetical protein